MAWRFKMCVAAAFLVMSTLHRPVAAATPLSDAGPVLQGLGKQLEDQSRPIAERLQVIRTFGDWGTDQVRPALVAALKDPEPQIREAAAQALGRRGNNQAVGPLRERVEDPKEVATVKAA